MILLYIYITCFTLYFLILTIASSKREKKIRDKYTSKDMNLCVVLYATGSNCNIENLIKQLKNQSYPVDKYAIYAILDKCENIDEVTLQTETKVNIISINNLEPIGKSQAYSIIAEKMHDLQGLDAYIFLDANNNVDDKFLENVNFYLSRYEVFSSNINYIKEQGEMSFWENVKTAYSLYCSKFICNTRSKLGLTNILNSDAFIIKRELLNKIAVFDFRDMISEVNYTLRLASEGIKVSAVNDINVYTDISNFKLRIPSLSKRFGIFWNNICKISNWRVREFLFSLIAPNWWTCVLIYALILCHSFRFSFIVDYYTILITTIILATSFCISMMRVKFYPKEYFYLSMYPIYSLTHMIHNFPLIRGIRNIIHNTTRKHVIEKMSTPVTVTDGEHEYTCELELISDDGLSKVTFINHGKKYTTKNNHLRMTDALKELSSKLSDYGLSLKVCQCCKYYQPLVDGSTNMVKGCCNCQFEGRTPGDMIPTLIWNTCPKYEKINVVNLF